MAITKPEQHEINQSGKRLLREALEPIGWVVNDAQEDYGIDCNVQVFQDKSPTGAWFHVQLKSSASSNYSSDQTFISQELLVDHARHYALEMREPVLLIHADVASKAVYWHAPQLDHRLSEVLAKTGATFITVRIPTQQQLPKTAPELLSSLDNIYLVLGARAVTVASAQSFAESFSHLPNQEVLYRAFQEKAATLKLQKVLELYAQKRFDEARTRVETLIADPDSTIEIKFWAHVQSEGIDYTETLHSGQPQVELSRLKLAYAKSLQKLTASGPRYLKFYSLIARKAAELEVLAHENFALFMAHRQHLERHGNPMTVLGLFAKRSAVTARIIAKYNQCIRLARYASNYPDRWVLGRALTNIATSVGPYLITLRAESKIEAGEKFGKSALQISQLAAWICNETGDPNGVVLAIISALTTVSTTDSDAYRWAEQLAHKLMDSDLRADALNRIERAARRWKGETVEGDYHGNTIWQVIQNMATALHVDTTNDNDPLVRGLKIAARDNTPESVLVHCEHLLVSLGAMGPTAVRIRDLFGISTAGSKVVHCTLHNFHVEGKDQDSAYAEFKKTYCDSCSDQKPRPVGWRYTDEVSTVIQAKNYQFVARLAGTAFGLRYTDED